MTLVTSKPKEIFGYEVVSLLHESPKGKLYAVCEPNSVQLRLMKHVVRKTDADLQLIDRLRAEFDLQKSLRSQVLRRGLDLKVNKKLIGGITEAALVMHLVDGDTLESLPLMPPRRVMEVFTELARGIASLHNQRLIHTEINPHHIMICNDGQVRLIDFGSVGRVNTLSPPPNPLHDFYGPELARMKPLVPQTDIYSFGASMYWALTGKRIPNLKSLHQGNWDRLQDDDEIPSPFALNPSIPEPLSKLTMWCCKLALGSRPRDMDTVIAGFDKIRDKI